MNEGNKRRNQKRKNAMTRYKVRYDRILAAVLALAAVSVVASSCVNGLIGNKNNKSDSGDVQSSTAATSQSTIVDNLDPKDENVPVITQTKPTEEEETTDVSKKYSSKSVSNDDIYKGDLILINSENPYKFPENDTDVVTMFDHIDTSCISVCDLVTKLDSKVIEQLNALFKGFIDEGNENDITVIGAYRSFEEQNDKYYSGLSGFGGGYTDYHSARSFDIGIFPKDGSSSGYYSSVGNYAWIDENAADFGFILRFPDEKEEYTKERARTYTYRYVGIPHSVYIKQHDLCLEEYLKLLKDHNSSNPLEINVGADIYNVYYVPKGSGDTTEVPVPSGMDYTISGDNSGGFIVSALMK
ncbi:MAG: D-alanyl-D-alanine carboxypeptidase family protein [Ruminococcus sp.]|nr:D-alanyl-D-alanine carboxypeptidase family protein [Ruminococcus sp.]